MDDTPRRALRALAQCHGLSRRSLTLIQEAALRLSDAQIRVVYEAVETCVLSGLTERDVARVIAEHRARAPQDWRASFWAERLALANERERLALARAQEDGEPPAAEQSARSAAGLTGGRQQVPPVAPIGPQPPEHAPPRADRAAATTCADRGGERATPVAPIPPQAPDPAQARTAPVAPIPPQPPSQLGADRREPVTDVTAERQPIDTAARRAA